jgi:hypothetical protein
MLVLPTITIALDHEFVYYCTKQKELPEHSWSSGVKKQNLKSNKDLLP